MKKFYICSPIYAQMVELVDTRVSKTRIARCAGSTPALGTKKPLPEAGAFFIVR